MKKVLVLVVVLALMWALPPVRERVSTAAVPLLEKLGPVGAIALKPARRMTAANDLKEAARLMDSDLMEGRRLPEARVFNRWLRGRFPGEDGLDPWGNPYWMRTGGVVTLGSNGPDGVQDTPDDVLVRLEP